MPISGASPGTRGSTVHRGFSSGCCGVGAFHHHYTNAAPKREFWGLQLRRAAVKMGGTSALKSSVDCGCQSMVTPGQKHVGPRRHLAILISGKFNLTPETNLLLVLWHMSLDVFEPLNCPHVSQVGIEGGMETQVIHLPFTLPSLIRLIYL